MRFNRKPSDAPVENFSRKSLIATAVSLAAVLILLVPVRLDAYPVVYDWNKDVPSRSNPPVKTIVKFDTDTRLDMVRVYHLAPQKPITITLKGKSGSYQIKNFARVGAFGPKKQLQVYRADKPGIVVKAGDYQVMSSDTSTWLYNAETGNRGFLAIDGTRQSKELGQLAVGQRLVLDNIQFAGGTATILPPSFPTLNTLYSSLARSKTLKVELRGHINKPGARLDMKADNDLGGRRAKAVYDYLVNKGIAKQRLSYKGYGNTQMLHPKPQTPEQEAANRRVEAVVVAK
ncbi:MAG: OmpA family protein [Acidobacteria bacterium]|nr:MAG: OmpA family protein [Acidobacteriota bacterium]